jgi:O-antigen/teichoic acid export membrane protein
MDGRTDVEKGRRGNSADACKEQRMATLTDTSSPTADTGAQLMRRAPAGYLWNQAGAIWLFVSLLLFEVVVRRSLPASATNVFDLVSTAANLAFYLASFGLSSAGTVYLPRALVEGGMGQARALALRLVLLRLALAVLVALIIIFGLPALAAVADATGWGWAVQLTHSFTVQSVLGHRAVIAAYVVAVAMSTLLSSLLISMVRTGVVFIIGSLGQLVLLGLGYLLIHAVSGGVDGAISAQALASALTAIFFGFFLWRILRSGSNHGAGQPFWRPALRLGVAAWLVDLPNSSLVQPLAIGQLAAVAPGELLFFKSTYQMGDAGARFFTDGLGGISLALMSTSYAGKNLPQLATGWRTVNKLQVLLALPVIAFAIPHAAAIIGLLFGSLYAQAGPLLVVFLSLNGLAQLLGGATHQWALYVLGRQKWVVVSQWTTIAVLAVIGAVLVPRYSGLGAALGALVAVGIGRLVAQVMLLVLARVWVRRPYPVAFSAKFLLSLALPAVVTAIWQPNQFIAQLVSHLSWLPTTLSGVVQQGLTLTVEGVIFLVIFLICLRLVRPLDSEDAALLSEVPTWLQKVLLPFVDKRSLKRNTGT